MGGVVFDYILLKESLLFMKKSALLLLLATSAASLFGDQAWIGNVQNTSTSTHLTKINDLNAKGDQVVLQFHGAGTLTVDTSVSVDTVVFGTGSTNVSQPMFR